MLESIKAPEQYDNSLHSHVTWLGSPWVIMKHVIATDRHGGLHLALGQSEHPFAALAAVAQSKYEFSELYRSDMWRTAP